MSSHFALFGLPGGHGGRVRRPRAAASTSLVGRLFIAVVAGTVAWPAASAPQAAPAEPIESSAAPLQTVPTRLEPGRPIARTIAAAETHRYLLALEADHAVHLVATQLGADIVLTLRASDGTRIVEVDSPTGGRGAESIWFIAPASGEFHIDVRPFESSAGPYELTAATVRKATPDDATRVRIQELYTEASRLARRGTDGRRRAVAKLTEAATLARSIGEEEMAAIAISSLLEADVDAALELTALPSMPGKVAVFYSPGYETRAAALRDQLAQAVDFFERRLGVTPKIHLAVLALEHWSTIAVGGSAYGMPNSRFTRSGAGLVCLPATYDAFDEVGRGIKPNLPDAELEAFEKAGGSFEEGIRHLSPQSLGG